ncbi:uncharacterized protein LOC116343008 [Contarinia nasturtii]|uniref:uncharacterized protein LOC116343008 n=1 Tax=Contarinia nasturtii TaxID=265458 RepID=UPI0012D3CBD1|nr:uncharacterized protein LOC116343008 [Contarinia nasturtii]
MRVVTAIFAVVFALHILVVLCHDGNEKPDALMKTFIIDPATDLLDKILKPLQPIFLSTFECFSLNSKLFNPIPTNTQLFYLKNHINKNADEDFKKKLISLYHVLESFSTTISKLEARAQENNQCCKSFQSVYAKYVNGLKEKTPGKNFNTVRSYESTLVRQYLELNNLGKLLQPPKKNPYIPREKFADLIGSLSLIQNWKKTKNGPKSTDVFTKLNSILESFESINTKNINGFNDEAEHILRDRCPSVQKFLKELNA